jgi:hypothetical protein
MKLDSEQERIWKESILDPTQKISNIFKYSIYLSFLVYHSINISDCIAWNEMNIDG